MSILLLRLADFAWLLYAICGIGAVVFILLAVSHRRRSGASLTDYEREAMSSQVARYWRLAAVFVLVGLVVLGVQAYLLPRIPAQALEGEITPTAGGLELPTVPAVVPTATLISGAMPTVEANDSATVSTATPSATDTPEASPTSEPQPAIAVGVRLGNVAVLEGYDIVATDVLTTEEVGLILYWRALEGATAQDYLVFTHLLAPEPDPFLVAQHDGVPAAGARPTTSWEAGELIVDYHQLTFREAGMGYSGPAQLAVGFYDPNAPDVRVPVEGGGDFVLLPTTVNVVAAQ